MPPLRSLICANLLFALLQLIGCEQNPAGSGDAPSNPTQAVSITTQPASQIVPIGRAGTFTVVATGAAPLSYQWSEKMAATRLRPSNNLDMAVKYENLPGLVQCAAIRNGRV